MDFKSSSIGFMADQLAASVGVSVIFRRSGLNDLTLVAWAGSSDEIANKEFGILDSDNRDWMIRASDLASTHGEPQDGDLIIDGDGDTYEVAPLVQGEQGKAWVDTHKTIWRIHTQKTRET